MGVDVYSKSICLWLCITCISASSIEKNLLSHLFSTYSPRVRPVLNETTITFVSLNMRLLQLISINEKHQLIKIHCYLQIRWKNELLRWNPLEWGNLTYLNIQRKNIWTPDLILLNSGDKDGFKIQKGADMVKSIFNGNNEWFPKVLVTATFETDTKYFPFDSQSFHFRFESWSFPDNKLRIVKSNQSVVDVHYVSSTIWDLKRIKKELSTRVYGKDEMYSELCFTVQYSRRPSYFIETIILPCILLVLTVFFTFFLPINCYGLMYVLVILLLGYTVFLELVASSLPNNTDSTPLILVYILAIIINCSISFFITCVVKSLQYKIQYGKMTHSVPRWMKRFLQNQINDGQRLNGKNNLEKQDMIELTILQGKMSDSLAQRRKPEAVPPKQIDEILNDVRRISSTLDKKDKLVKARSDWMRIAKKIDRINFWFYLSVSVLTHFLIYLGFKKYY